MNIMGREFNNRSLVGLILGCSSLALAVLSGIRVLMMLIPEIYYRGFPILGYFNYFSIGIGIAGIIYSRREVQTNKSLHGRIGLITSVIGIAVAVFALLFSNLFPFVDILPPPP